jgi:hypothetical protein
MYSKQQLAQANSKIIFITFDEKLSPASHFVALQTAQELCNHPT